MRVEASNSIWKETRVVMLYDHPNIVKMYGVANDITPYYVVMKLVGGGALDRYLKKMGSKLNIKARVNILIEAASGLEYLHTKGWIHRDIACRNLLIAKVVKVPDLLFLCQVIFTDRPRFTIIENIFVAMLIQIRSLLLLCADYSAAKEGKG